MPEQFEVTRMADYLKSHQLESQKLKCILFSNQGQRILKNISPEKLNQQLCNKQLLTISTKAKYTFLYFESGTLVWHYRFTGIAHLKDKPYQQQLYSLFSLPIESQNQKHLRMTLSFEKDELYYIDTRCLSALYFFKNCPPEQTDIYQSLAADLMHDLNPDISVFKKLFSHRKTTVKQWLLNQEIAPSGIGNYLACEILAHAKLNPFTPLQKINKQEYLSICQAIKRVRDYALKSPRYDWFLVFNKKFCGQCGTQVQKQKQPKNAQTSHFCLTCQKLNCFANQ